MVICKNCWTNNPDDANYCMECGIEIYAELESEIRGLLQDLESNNQDIRMKASIKLSNYLNPNFSPNSNFQSELVRKIILDSGIDPMITALKNGPYDFKVTIAWCFGYLDDEIAVNPLIESLNDLDVLGASVENLVRLKKFSTEPLLNILSSENENVVNASAGALGEIGDDRAVEPLLNLLFSNSTTSYAVSDALSKIKSPKAVPPLLKALNSEDKKLKRLCALILGNINDKRAVDPLIDSLNDKDAHFRRQVVIALGKLNDIKTLEHFILALNDKAAVVRGAAAQCIGEMGDKDSIQYLKPLLNDKNENVKKTAQLAIKKINNSYKKRVVPEWDGYYPSLESATPEQKKFYYKWLSELDWGNYIDIEENLSYIFVYLYDVIENFIQNKDINQLIESFEKINSGYSHYEKIGPYLTSWKSDAFLYLDDKESALETLIGESGELRFRNALEYTILKADYSAELIDGNDLVNIIANQTLTDFGMENKTEIGNIATNELRKFQIEYGKPIINYFIEEFNLQNLTNEDFKSLKPYFKYEDDFLKFREIYEKNERDKKDLTYPGFMLAEELEFHGFIGVPISRPYEDPKFKKVIHQQYDAKKIYVPAIIIEAIKNEFKRILRQSENNLRIKRDLPKIGEGWISETDLYYKIKEAFSDEEIVHHGRPKWLGKQHIDIYFPKRNIAIEYQGEQHQNPSEYFGGERSFKKQQELDKRKLDLCKHNKCNLIYVYPDYDFEEVKKSIKNFLL